MQNTNTLAYAKIVQNKKLKTLRMLVTFDIYAYNITTRNSAFLSGDICNISDSTEVQQRAIQRTLQQAIMQLRTDNIQFV